MDLNGTDPTVIVAGENNAIALDFDYRQDNPTLPNAMSLIHPLNCLPCRQNSMYWTDVTRQVIRQATLNGSGATDVVSGGLNIPGTISPWGNLQYIICRRIIIVLGLVLESKLYRFKRATTP